MRNSSDDRQEAAINRQEAIKAAAISQVCVVQRKKKVFSRNITKYGPQMCAHQTVSHD